MFFCIKYEVYHDNKCEVIAMLHGLQHSHFITVKTTSIYHDLARGGQCLRIQAMKFDNGECVDVFDQWAAPTAPFPKTLHPSIRQKEKELQKKRSIYYVITKFFSFAREYPLFFYKKREWERYIKPLLAFVGKPTSPFLVYAVQEMFKKLDPSLPHEEWETLLEHLNIQVPSIAEDEVQLYALFELKSWLLYATNQPINQIPMYRAAQLDDYFYPYRILRVAYWTKHTRHEQLHRLYVLTDRGTVYYDIIHDVWCRGHDEHSFHGSIEMYEMEQRVLSFLNLSHRTELKKYRSKKAIARPTHYAKKPS